MPPLALPAVALPADILAPPRYTAAPDMRSRVVAALLSVGLVALIMLVLVEMGVVDLASGPVAPPMVSVTVKPPPPAASGGGARRKIIAKQAPRTATAPVAQPHPTTPHPVPSPRPAASFIHLSSQEFASAEIGRMARPDANASSDGDGADSAQTYGPGEGPGGTRLYNARWYREPSSAELDPYFQHYPPAGSWADIRCRTAEHYHVEDCEEIAESAPGLGASRALRQAGWQFLVVPPRVNGQPMIGVWVKIRMFFTGVGLKHEERDPAIPKD